MSPARREPTEGKLALGAAMIGEGRPVREICGELGISSATFYKYEFSERGTEILHRRWVVDWLLFGRASHRHRYYLAAYRRCPWRVETERGTITRFTRPEEIRADLERYYHEVDAELERRLVIGELPRGYVPWSVKFLDEEGGGG